MVEILLPFYPDERTAKKRGRSQKIFTGNCNFTAEGGAATAEKGYRDDSRTDRDSREIEGEREIAM